MTTHVFLFIGTGFVKFSSHVKCKQLLCVQSMSVWKLCIIKLKSPHKRDVPV